MSKIGNDVRVVIVTKGRADKQITLKNMWQFRENIEIICHPGDYDRLRGLYSKEAKNIIPYPVELDNHIGKLRQWIVDNTNQKYLLFLDDNLAFHTRRKSELAEDTKYPLKGLIDRHFSDAVKQEELNNMVENMLEEIKTPDVALVGLSTRSGNHTFPGDKTENTRIFGLSMIDLEIMKKEDIRYDTVNLKEDFYINLSFLTKGYRNICIYNYAFDKPQANMPGGCSSFRTVEKSNESAKILKDLFPNFVSIREKSVKSWGGEFTDTALDVSVQWKKAFLSSIKNESQEILNELF